ncbi:hypothetical protein LCGC14_1284340, partial [marine sediment metagenome]
GQPQPVNWLSMPVSVITAEDIHYSGLTRIDEVLQFTPGVDVQMHTRNHVAVGVRGLHDVFADRLLSLVDGRAADNALHGGPNFLRLPVMMEDIKRIEVVRGPAGAAWGANAFTGAVNIITKDPEDALGLFASTTVNSFGETYNYLRWAEKHGPMSGRVSVGYENWFSSDSVIDRHVALSNDFSRNWRFDSKGVYRPDDRTKWSGGLAHYHGEVGAQDTGTRSRQTGRSDLARTFLRFEREALGGTSGHLQWFGNFDQTSRSSASKYYTSENDLEGQLNFHPGGGHRLSVGGNLRWVHVAQRSSDLPTNFVIDNLPVDEYWGGLFMTDRFQATDRLVLEAQLRGDRYSETQSDWAGRFTALYALDEPKRHVVRLSTAKAFRTPLAAVRRARVKAVAAPSPPFPAGSFLVNLLRPSENMHNEETWSVEAGYSGRFTDWLKFRADAYFQRFERLIGTQTLPDPLALGRSFTSLANLAGADSYGIETQLTAKGKAGKISVWYALNRFQPDHSGQAVRAYLPAEGKAGITGRVFCPDDWTLNANYKYTTVASGGHLTNAVSLDGPEKHRLDLTISKRFAEGRGEFMIGVSDVFNEVRDATSDVSRASTLETPGRAFFIRLQWEF